MKAEDIYDWLGNNTSPDYDVVLEVGNCGEDVHSREIVSMRADHAKMQVVISTEEPGGPVAPTLEQQGANPLADGRGM